jgi:hypothetical protein
MADKKNLLLLFERPNEPVFTPKVLIDSLRQRQKKLKRFSPLRERKMLFSKFPTTF